MNPTRKLLLAGMAFMLLAGLCVWLFWGNRGILRVTADPPAFAVTVSGFGKLPCTAAACQLTVPFGKREVCLQAEGYEQICETIVIPWRGQVDWQPKTVRLPHFLSIPPGEGPVISPIPTAKPVTPYRIDEEMRLVHDDQGKASVITVFQDLTAPTLTLWQERLLVVSAGEVFLVDPIRKSKQRIFSGSEPVLRLLSDEVALVADADFLWVFTQAGDRFRKLPIVAPADWVVACEATRLIAVSKQAGGDTLSILIHDLTTGVTREVAQAVIKNPNGLALSCVPDDPQAVRLDLAEGEDRILKF